MRTYLNLPERLSQVWVNQWTILCILSCLKVYLFQRSLKQSIDESASYTGLICDDINIFSSAISQLPLEVTTAANRLMTLAVNELTAYRVEFLNLLITIVEYIIIFYIEVLFGTFTCLLTAAINGTVDVAFEATDAIIVAVNLTIIAAANDIQQGLNGLSMVLNSLTSAFNSVASSFDGQDPSSSSSSTYISQINLTISALQDVQIPALVTDKINSVKTDIPSFSTNSTVSFIESTFDELKLEIISKLSKNISLATNYQPNIPSVKICNSPSDITKVYQDIADNIHKGANWIMILLILLAFVATIPIAFMEWRRWRKETQMAKIMYDMSIKNPGSSTNENLLGTFNYFSNCLIYYTNKFFTPPHKVQWVLSYILSPVSVVLLGIGVAALVTVLLQYYLLSALTNGFNGLKNDFNGAVDDLESTMDVVSSNWTSATNSFLSQEEKVLNNDLFGWVNKTTFSVNDTVNAIISDLNIAMSVFNNTLLYAPMQTVVYCTIGRKLDNIQSGLDWVQNNFVVRLPRVTKSMIQVSNNSSIVDNTLKDVKTKLESILASTVTGYKGKLQVEMYVAIGFLLLWVLQILNSLLIIMFKIFYGRYFSQTHHINEKNSISKLQPLQISSPKQLTNKEKQVCGYPYIDPFERYPIYDVDPTPRTSSLYSLYNTEKAS